MSAGRERAPLIEVFHSIQGEGRHVGRPMAFVRVATCPIRCRYCDTTHSYTAAARFACPGAGVDAEPNPVTADRAAELVRACARRSPFGEPGPLRVSVTGGEPLVVPGFVTALAAALGDEARVHLETALLDPEALQQCLPALAHLSADYKLPSTLHGGADHGAAHAAALELAAVRPAAELSIDVKLVLTADHGTAEFVAALERLRPFRGRILLFLQPVTPQPGLPEPLPRALLAERAAGARDAGFALRVLPQVHPWLGVE